MPVELDQMHPALRVELDPLFLKGNLMLICLFYAVAVVCAVVALAAAIHYFAAREKPNQAIELTASRRTAKIFVTSAVLAAATRALARSSSSCSR